MLDLGEDCSRRSMVKHYGSDSNARQLNVQLLRKIAVPEMVVGEGGITNLFYHTRKLFTCAAEDQKIIGMLCTR